MVKVRKKLSLKIILLMLKFRTGVGYLPFKCPLASASKPVTLGFEPIKVNVAVDTE